MLFPRKDRPIRCIQPSIYVRLNKNRTSFEGTIIMRDTALLMLLTLPISLFGAENGAARAMLPYTQAPITTPSPPRPLSPTTRGRAIELIQQADQHTLTLKERYEQMPAYSSTKYVLPAGLAAGGGMLWFQRSKVKTRGFGTTIALMVAGAVFSGGFLAIWEGDRIQNILGLERDLKELKAELIKMQDNVAKLNTTSTELQAKVEDVGPLLKEAREGVEAVKLVSGDNARLSDIMLQLIGAYRELDERMREMALMLPEDERDQFLKPIAGLAGDRDMSEPAEIIPEADRIQMNRRLAVKEYNAKFKLKRWNRVHAFEDIPEAIRKGKYAHLMS